jgi:hypothetical protein
MVRKRRIKDFSRFQKLDYFMDFNPIQALSIAIAKKILSRGEAIFQRYHKVS